jgi:protein O-mannosyl-transferase
MNEISTETKILPNGLSAPLKNKADKKFILFYLLIIISLTIIAYSTSIKNDFAMNWDDDVLVVNNNHIKELSIENIWKIITNFKGEGNNYLPFKIISYALEYKFFGLNPLAYHADNLIIHLLNVILVFFFIYLLTITQSTVYSPQLSSLRPRTSDFRLQISAIVALFFAIQPMNVQAIAWISSRCTGMFTFFYIGGLITYIRSQKLEVRSQKNKYLIFTFILFIFSLLSKSSAVTFPLVLILIDYYKGNFTINSKLKIQNLKLLEKLPFFILAIIFSFISNYARKDLGILEIYSISTYTIFDKIFIVFYSAGFYIIKLFIPASLCVHHFYPVKISGLLPVEYYLSPAFISGIVIAVIKIKSSELKKDVIFGLLFYLATIAIVLHFIPFSFYITGERYAYLPYIGLIFATGKICLNIIENNKLLIQNKKLKIQIFVSMMIIVALIFSLITYERNKIYKNNISLYADEIKNNSTIFLPFWDRGNLRVSLGDFKGALNDFNKAIEINPKISKLYNVRGNVKASLGEMLGAVQDFNKAIEINPNFTEAINTRGSAKYFLGDKEGAVEDYSKAIVLNPKFTEAYNNRGMAKKYLGDTYGACQDWTKAANLGNKKAYDLIQKYCK